MVYTNNGSASLWTRNLGNLGGSVFRLRKLEPGIPEEKNVPHCLLTHSLSPYTIMFQTLEFETKFSGILKATRNPQNESIEMQLPLNPPNQFVSHADDKAIWQLVQEVLKGQPKWTLQDVKEVKLSPVTKKLLIRLSDHICQSELEAMERPDGIATIDTRDRVRGVIVTVKSPKKYDFLSRYFAPWVGIPEDPVTGSAHTVLGPYWAENLGKKDFFARQCSKRGGEVTLHVGDDFLRISGSATIVLKGAITF